MGEPRSSFEAMNESLVGFLGVVKDANTATALSAPPTPKKNSSPASRLSQSSSVIDSYSTSHNDSATRLTPRRSRQRDSVKSSRVSPGSTANTTKEHQPKPMSPLPLRQRRQLRHQIEAKSSMGPLRRQGERRSPKRTSDSSMEASPRRRPVSAPGRGHKAITGVKGFDFKPPLAGGSSSEDEREIAIKDRDEKNFSEQDESDNDEAIDIVGGLETQPQPTRTTKTKKNRHSRRPRSGSSSTYSRNRHRSPIRHGSFEPKIPGRRNRTLSPSTSRSKQQPSSLPPRTKEKPRTLLTSEQKKKIQNANNDDFIRPPNLSRLQSDFSSVYIED